MQIPEYPRGYCINLAKAGKFSKILNYLETCDFTIIKFMVFGNEHTIENIQNGKIWFSNVATFNDPLDTTYKLPTLIERMFDGNKYYDTKTTSDILKEKLDKYRNMTFASCFCDKNLLFNTKMWLLYADEYKGICCEYSISDIAKTLKKYYFEKYEFAPITYTNDFGNLDNPTNEEDRYSIFFSKSPCWKDENEWRITFFKETEDTFSGKENPFIKPVKIYLGPLMNEETQNKMKESLDVDISNMYFDYKKLSLRIEK